MKYGEVNENKREEDENAISTPRWFENRYPAMHQNRAERQYVVLFQGHWTATDKDY